MGWGKAQAGTRVMVAMSGGVDSAVTAHLLQSQGYAVQGLTMRMWQESDDPANMPSARSVCQYLGIDYHEVDLSQAFYDEIVSYFVKEYARGRTPNPCVRCNRLIKFGMLSDHALALGADYLATGHYARVEKVDGECRLLCGKDAHKDQSYFLYALSQQQLRSSLFPLGEWRKTDVREYARQHGLPVAERAESQDICFLPSGDYRAFLKRHAPEALRSGPIYDREGQLLGEHQGLAFYTIGQRGGMGISAPKPLYVIDMDPKNNALTVGFVEELGRNSLLAQEITFISGEWPEPGSAVEAKIRYRAKRAAAHIWPEGPDAAKVVFDQPLRDIAPGQSVVFYYDDRVLGGGIISSSGQAAT